jgi:hypothetical protein
MASFHGHVEVVRLLLAVPGIDFSCGEYEVKDRKKENNNNVQSSNSHSLSHSHTNYLFLLTYFMTDIRRIAVHWMKLVGTVGMKLLNCCWMRKLKQLKTRAKSKEYNNTCFTALLYRYYVIHTCVCLFLNVFGMCITIPFSLLTKNSRRPPPTPYLSKTQRPLSYLSLFFKNRSWKMKHFIFKLE